MNMPIFFLLLSAIHPRIIFSLIINWHESFHYVGFLSCFVKEGSCTKWPLTLFSPIRHKDSFCRRECAGRQRGYQWMALTWHLYTHRSPQIGLMWVMSPSLRPAVKRLGKEALWLERRGKYFHRRSRTLYLEKGGPTGHLMVISIVHSHNPPEKRRLCKGDFGHKQRFRSRGMLDPQCWVHWEDWSEHFLLGNW